MFQRGVPSIKPGYLLSVIVCVNCETQTLRVLSIVKRTNDGRFERYLHTLDLIIQVDSTLKPNMKLVGVGAQIDQ